MVTPTNMIPPAYLSPQGGASLLLSFKLERKTVAIIGGNGLAASRVFAALEADAKVIVLCEDGELGACDELKWRAAQGQISIRNTNTSSSTTIAPSSKTRTGSVFEALETLLANETIHFVCITDTILSAGKRSHASALRLVEICRSHRVLVNVTDEPALCDFSFTATHRFIDSKTGAKTPLQIGVTTNGKGCRLAGRVRREIVARLPRTVGAAAAGVSRLREMAKEGSEDEDQEQNLNVEAESGAGEEGATSTLNRPVAQRRVTDTENASDRTKRQLRWVAQVSEYWPLAQLAAMDEEDAMKILTGGFDMGMGSSSSSTSTKTTTTMATAMARPPLHSSDTDMISLHALSLSNPPAAPPRKGRILLVGSGPGHPSLLTRATYTALTELADLVLSDKLVPSAVLELIPPTVEVRIARKFPGNAEGAQTEMMEAAVEAANKGLTVVRLKQGDPTVYGRAGEEVIFFRQHGFECLVVPGVTSALAGPIFAGIPVTQRGVAESVIVCTGVGRAGKEVQLPGYERGRTLVVLMGVARLGALLEALKSEEAENAGRRAGQAYPPNLPIAIIERATMPDQRTVYSTLENIAVALESVGEQRPPGMIVIGWSALALWKEGDMTVLDKQGQEEDKVRVKTWLGGEAWRVVEGLDEAWDDL